MTLENIRTICRMFPGVTEDVKWGNGIGFKCTPEDFGELTERPGVRPAPYLARAMWVQEEVLGSALSRGDFERLLRSAYELVVAKLPQSRRPGAATQAKKAPRRRSGTPSRRRGAKKRR